MTARSDRRHPTLLVSAQLVLLALTVPAAVAHRVPGPFGWSYALPAAVMVAMAAGAGLALVRPRAGRQRRWAGPVGFAGLVVVLQVPPVITTTWLGLPLVTAAAMVTVAAAADAACRAARPIDGPRAASESFEPGLGGGLLGGGLLGAVVAAGIVALGTPPLIWVVVVVTGYAATTAAGAGLRLWSLAVFLVPVLAVGPAMMDDAAIRTPLSAVRVAPTLTGTTDLMINNAPAGDIRDAWSWERDHPFVGAPYAVRAKHERILVLDAGGGNAVGRALAADPNRVDAVEADRGLVSAGRRFRPDLAYDDSRVFVHEQDPRAALRRLTEPYDLIVVARADPRLLTTAALARIRDLLTTDGIVAVHDGDHGWLGPTARAARSVFGHEPCVWDDPTGFAVVTALDSDRLSCRRASALAAGDPPTENRPFSAAQVRSLALVGGLTTAVLLAVAFLLVALTRRPFVRPAGVPDEPPGRPRKGTRAGPGGGLPRAVGPVAVAAAVAVPHGIATAPILRDIPLDGWAVGLVDVVAWLGCLVLAGWFTRRLPAGPVAVVVAALVVLVLVTGAVLPTERLAFSGGISRLAGAALLVGAPILLGAVLLVATARGRPAPVVVTGILAGVAVGAALTGLVGMLGYSGLFVVAGVGPAFIGVARARRRSSRAVRVTG